MSIGRRNQNPHKHCAIQTRLIQAKSSIRDYESPALTVELQAPAACKLIYQYTGGGGAGCWEWLSASLCLARKQDNRPMHGLGF